MQDLKGGLRRLESMLGKQRLLDAVLSLSPNLLPKMP